MGGERAEPFSEPIRGIQVEFSGISRRILPSSNLTKNRFLSLDDFSMPVVESTLDHPVRNLQTRDPSASRFRHLIPSSPRSCEVGLNGNSRCHVW